MHLFITGGTGFVGSSVVRAASQAGHWVSALRRPGSVSRVEAPEGVQWIDAALDADLTPHFAGVDCLVHLAAHTPNPPYAPLDECLYWNVFASAKLIQAAAAAGVADFLVAGTCFEYGLAAEGKALIHPSCELRPVLTYPVSKAAASIALLGLARQLDLRMQLVRIFQVFGEGEAPSRFWPSLRRAALDGADFPMSAGVQVRDFVDVADVAAQFVSALDFRNVERGRPQIRNCGSGQASSLLEFAQHWWHHWGATGRLLPGSVGLRPGELACLVPNVVDVHVG